LRGGICQRGAPTTIAERTTKFADPAFEDGVVDTAVVVGAPNIAPGIRTLAKIGQVEQFPGVGRSIL